MNLNDLKRAVVEQFGPMAEAYRTSAVHARGADLARLVALAAPQPSEVALDAGCGAGHTAAAIAPLARSVVALDLSDAMLSAARKLANERGLRNMEFRRGDVEALPFDESSFDLVVSRYSAHHWPNPQLALHEIRRVLRPGGRLVLGDIVAFDAPLLDTHLQAMELLRDASHVRDHSVAQWRAFFGVAGFSVQVVEPFECSLLFNDWVERIATPAANVQVLRALLAAAPEEVRVALQLEPGARTEPLLSFTIPGALLVARPTKG